MSLKQKCWESNFKLDNVSMTESVILLMKKADGKRLNYNKIINVLFKQKDKKRESILEFEKGKRWDYICKTRFKIEILLKYLPQHLSKKKLSYIFRKAVNKVGLESMNSKKYGGSYCT